MSFESIEESRAKGRPVYLMFVRYGPNPEAFYAYTTCDQSIEFDGVAYQPIPLDIPDRDISGDLDKTSLEVTVSRNAPVAELFRVTPPSYVVGLIIRQGHYGGDEFPVVWVGRILGSAREGSQVKLICEPSSTALRTPALRRNYMYSCPHVLYGPQCRASLTAATVTLAVESLTGSTVTLPDGWEPLDRALKYRGGMVRWVGAAGDVVRSIIGLEAGRVLRLNGATNELNVGDSIRVSLGCNHNFVMSGGSPQSDCQELHNNIHNYGGQPFIPTNNPVGTRLNIFY